MPQFSVRYEGLIYLGKDNLSLILFGFVMAIIFKENYIIYIFTLVDVG